MKPSNNILNHAADTVAYILEPLLSLPPLGRRELMAAKRRGEDSDELVSGYWPHYETAWLEIERRVDEVAKRRSVPPCEISSQVVESDDLARVLEQRTPPSRWGAEIPRVLNVARARASRPTRRGRVVVRRRSRTHSPASPTRGDPDDGEPHEPRLLTDVLPGYLERLLARTGPERAHDYLVARRIGKKVF